MASMRRRSPAGPPAGPPTEIVRPNATTVTSSVLNGGASAHAILSDQSDASYLSQVTLPTKGGDYDTISWIGGMSDLVDANGRGIASFTWSVRAEKTAGTLFPNGCVLDPYLSTSPGFTTATLTGSAATFTSGAFTKSGGGNWTAAEFDAGLWELLMTSDQPGTMTGRIYDSWVTVTFA